MKRFTNKWYIRLIEETMPKLRAADWGADMGNHKAVLDQLRIKKILDYIEERTGIDWFEFY